MGPSSQFSPPLSAARRTALPIALACVVVAAVAFISFLPTTDKQFLHTTGRLHFWGHFFAFALIGFVASRASTTLRTRILVFVGALAFGFSIEAGEHLFFHGFMEWKDVLVDALGVISGTLLAFVTRQKQPV